MTTTTMTAPTSQLTGCSDTASASPAGPPGTARPGHPAHRTRPRPSGPRPSHPRPAPASAREAEDPVDQDPVDEPSTAAAKVAADGGAGGAGGAAEDTASPEPRIAIAHGTGAPGAGAGRVVEPEPLIGTDADGHRRGLGVIDLSEVVEPYGHHSPSTTRTRAPGRVPARERTAMTHPESGEQGRSTPPHPARSAAVIVVAAAEVLAGQRPVDHLTRWTTPAMFEAIARRAGLASRVLGARRRSHRPRMRSVHTQLTVSGACEATILLEDSGRVRAAAAHLIIQRGRWILAGLEIA